MSESSSSKKYRDARYNHAMNKVRAKSAAVKSQQAKTEIKCKTFGCPIYLSHTELLYSEHCFKHQLEINQNKTIW